MQKKNKKKSCTNCLRVALGLIFIIAIIYKKMNREYVVHCVKVSPARQKKKQTNKQRPVMLYHTTRCLLFFVHPGLVQALLSADKKQTRQTHQLNPDLFVFKV